jgi:Transposase zinc-binding domain
MHPACAPSGTRSVRRPALELADIVRLHAEALRQRRVLTPEQHATLRAIERCRTAALGGHLDVCLRCGQEKLPSYNSCRNRHCPKCQALAQARWVEARSARLLPVPYFHVVFTLPAELRAVAGNCCWLRMGTSCAAWCSNRSCRARAACAFIRRRCWLKFAACAIATASC